MFYFNLVKFFGFLVMAYCFRNIIEFSIEDTFMLDIISPVLLSNEYARSFSWLLLAGLLFLLVDFVVLRFLQDKDTPNSLRLKKLSLVIVAVVLTGYLAHVVYLFLSGRGVLADMWRLLLTMSLLVAAITYIYVELCVRPKCCGSNFWLGVSGGMVLLLVGTGFVSLMKFAPPLEMRKLEIDRQKMNLVHETFDAIGDFFRKHNALPKDLRELPNAETYQGLSYTIASPKKATICTPLIGNWKYGRRLNAYLRTKPKQGETSYCTTTSLDSEKVQNGYLGRKHSY